MDNNSAYALVSARAEKFQAFVQSAGADECWHWGRSRNAAGYGTFYVGKSRIVKAHRAAWMLANNKPIPDGLLVCHSCDTPSCCNPRHLWVGTDADNNADRARKGRTVKPPRNEELVPHQRGVDHHSSKLTEDQVFAIFNDERNTTVLGRIYGLNPTSVSKIKRGISYPRLLAPLLKARSQLKGNNNG